MRIRAISIGLAAGLALAALSFGAVEAAAAKQYFGLYRGLVVLNQDPELLGRLQLVVPQVTGQATTGWALPVLQYPYKVSSLKLPKIGQSVWVEYEQGNPAYPVWIGAIPVAGQ
jgi:hypothetical protein